MDLILSGRAVHSDEALAARLRGSLGNSLYLAGDHDGAIRALQACYGYARDQGDHALESLVLGDLGNVLAAHAADDALWTVTPGASTPAAPAGGAPGF